MDTPAAPLIAQVDAVVKAIKEELPPVATWKVPTGYPTSVALCVLDAIWSIGVNYDDHVVPVLRRYVEHREVSISTCCDTAAQLTAVIDAAGGSDGFANNVVRNRQRTSTKGGVLKAEACLQAARLLDEEGVVVAADLVARADEIERGWKEIPGQRSGISWTYVQMLAGQDGVKPDRMIMRFLQEPLRGRLNREEAIEVLHQVALHPDINVDTSTLDHAIWQHVRPRKPAKR